MAAVERLVNLALLLAAAAGPVTADRIRSEGVYPDGQDDAAFLRMFERDKDDLRSMGFVIEADETGGYRLDARATFASAVDLSHDEVAVLGVVGAALLDDESYPFTDDLRLALAKVSAEARRDGAASARLADEDPGRQGSAVATLSAAAAACKQVGFGYTNSSGASAPHMVEPYGLFLHDGRWYLVGRDTAKDDVRTYAVARMEEVSANAARPKTPDFERPHGFDVALFARLPFQYGAAENELLADVVIDASAAWRARALSAGQGDLSTPGDDGSVRWRVPVRSRSRFLRFVLENGPGITVAGPADLVDEVRAGLARTGALHG